MVRINMTVANPKAAKRTRLTKVSSFNQLLKSWTKGTIFLKLLPLDVLLRSSEVSNKGKINPIPKPSVIVVKKEKRTIPATNQG